MGAKPETLRLPDGRAQKSLKIGRGHLVCVASKRGRPLLGLWPENDGGMTVMWWRDDLMVEDLGSAKERRARWKKQAR